MAREADRDRLYRVENRDGHDQTASGLEASMRRIRASCRTTVRRDQPSCSATASVV